MTSSQPVKSPPNEIPAWIPKVLYAAAIYNVAWGAFVVLFPMVPFRLAGMEPPNYPAIVQCLGMVVGVYGVGYALAAQDPVTLWPLVFVGLLGKVFGPIGFVYAAIIGEFPWRCGLTILTNDVAWWLPFVAILLHVARIRDYAHRSAGLELAEVLRTAMTQNGQSLYDLSQQQDLLVVCLRHSGCTYCREALADLGRQQAAIRQSGIRPVVIHMSSEEQGHSLLAQYGCADIDHVSDPTRRIYRALELRLGTLTELFGVKAFWRALIGGTIFKYGFGPIVGNAQQLAGAFVIRNGAIVRSFRHRSSSDRADYQELACSYVPSEI